MYGSTFNQDGDWEDTLECKSEDGNVIQVAEWAVQNHGISVVYRYETLTTPEFNATTQHLEDHRDIWMRVTLSEQPAPDIGDGRGPDSGYEYGETEDYLSV